MLLLGGVSSLFIAATVHANPNIADATIVNGDVSFSQPDESTLNITNTPGAIIDWDNFSIDDGKQTNFIQESANSRVLNRITGTSATNILGQLNSNGQVYLINPNGIVFGNNAVVDTKGLIASTLNMSNDDFIAEKDTFSGTTGTIINEANLSMNGDSQIVLLASDIENNGNIETENGRLILVAGTKVQLLANNLLFEVQAGDSALNLGNLVTESGAIGLFADQLVQRGAIQAQQTADGIIILEAKNSLEIDSSSITENVGGRITLGSEKDINIAGEVSAVAEEGIGGDIEIMGEQIIVSGVIDASGNEGGDIELFGEQITVSGTIDASGNEGGGVIELTSNAPPQNVESININDTAMIKADALENGDGGIISISTEATLNVIGRLSAKGGSLSGNGGDIETIGFNALNVETAPDVTAANGNAGNWLLLSDEIIIGSNEANVIANALNVDTHVDIEAIGSIEVNAPINKVAGEESSLLLLAETIDINAPIQSSSGLLNVVLLGGDEVNINADIDPNGGELVIEENVFEIFDEFDDEFDEDEDDEFDEDEDDDEDDDEDEFDDDDEIEDQDEESSPKQCR